MRNANVRLLTTSFLTEARVSFLSTNTANLFFFCLMETWDDAFFNCLLTLASELFVLASGFQLMRLLCRAFIFSFLVLLFVIREKNIELLFIYTC